MVRTVTTDAGSQPASAVRDRIPMAGRATARLAGAFYLLTIAAGVSAMLLGRHDAARWSDAANLVGAAAYVMVTILLFRLLRPTSRLWSTIAVVFSLSGCVTGALGFLHIAIMPINSLVLFGGYCVLTGCVMLRSPLFPTSVGALMIMAGLGWLTFVSPVAARNAAPLNMVAGIAGESVLTIWLLVAPVARFGEDHLTGARPTPPSRW